MAEEIGPLSYNKTNAKDWRKALDKVLPAVVVLKTTACRDFDTNQAGSSNATGFVVDKTRGIILSNRHVVKPGPNVAETMFVNHEEVPIYPLYRDPIHDFGFFRYDPAAVKFLSYEAIPLAPEAACVGLEIRVVGNDSSEKVSISAGTLARLDRDAPYYGSEKYNDFNIFYMQAASGTKGGSSGSPVIDCQGRAVALNAGSNKKSSNSFMLPLERVVRALDFLQKGKDLSGGLWDHMDISRGTLQVTFLHKAFSEARKLGLSDETEEMVRRNSSLNESKGMLVVDSVVPGGPAYNHLQPGDVLISVNGELVTRFLMLETLLDDNVNHKVEIQFQRGSNSSSVSLTVQDLHSVTPNFFLEVSGAVIHPLSYQQARNFHMECGLVYVAKTGYMLDRAGVPRFAIIKTFAGAEISQLNDLILALSKLSRGARVTLKYITHKDRHRIKSALVTIDRHEWYAPPQIYTRDDSSGLWIIKPALPPESEFLSSKGDCYSESVRQCINENFPDGSACDVPGMNESRDCEESNVNTKQVGLQEDFTDGVYESGHTVQEPLEEEFEDLRNPGTTGFVDNHGATSTIVTNASLAEQVIEPSLVYLHVHVPPSCILDGVISLHFSGTGVIVYHSEGMGLVAVDKNTVVVSVSDVMLSFAAYSKDIPGEVVFLHPVHNFALVAYDPSALGAEGVSVISAAQLLPEPALLQGDSVNLVGLNRSLRAKSRKTTVVNPFATMYTYSDGWPRYRATNMEVIELEDGFGETFSGLLTDELGRVRALWARFTGSKNTQLARGIPIYAISQVLEKIINSAKGSSFLINGITKPMPLVRILEAELHPRLLYNARNFGLSDNWIQALEKKDPIRRQVLFVKGCLAGSQAKHELKNDDMLLAIKKEPITCFCDIERACEELDLSKETEGKLHMTIFREGREMELLVGTDVRDGNGTTWMVNWCGCILQEPHPDVRTRGFLPGEGHGLYVAGWSHGSPANRYSLHTGQWIIEVNEEPTSDLDSFLKVVMELEDDKFVRIKTIDLNGKPRVLALKQDLHYWPTWELQFDSETATWRRKVIKALDVGKNPSLQPNRAKRVQFGKNHPYLSTEPTVNQSKEADVSTKGGPLDIKANTSDYTSTIDLSSTFPIKPNSTSINPLMHD